MSTWNPKQPFINGWKWWNNHFLCKDLESSNWNIHLYIINGWPWGSRYPCRVGNFRWPFRILTMRMEMEHPFMATSSTRHKREFPVGKHGWRPTHAFRAEHASRINVHRTPLKISMEATKTTNWKGTSSSKPPFWGSMLVFPGVVLTSETGTCECV